MDQAFTSAAGRDIWGFPKWVTTIDIDEPPPPAGGGAGTIVRLVDDGVALLTLTVAAGGRRLPAQAPRATRSPTGSCGAPAWTTSSDGVPGRIGGATLVLGHHPMADELRSLGLPKRALFTSSAASMRASFGAAEIVTAGRAEPPPPSGRRRGNPSGRPDRRDRPRTDRRRDQRGRSPLMVMRRMWRR